MEEAKRTTCQERVYSSGSQYGRMVGHTCGKPAGEDGLCGSHRGAKKAAATRAANAAREAESHRRVQEKLSESGDALVAMALTILGEDFRYDVHAEYHHDRGGRTGNVVLSSKALRSLLAKAAQRPRRKTNVQLTTSAAFGPVFVVSGAVCREILDARAILSGMADRPHLEGAEVMARRSWPHWGTRALVPVIAAAAALSLATAAPASASTTKIVAKSCIGKSFCMAVGSISTSDGASAGSETETETVVPFAERWDGSKWIVTKTPTPASGGSFTGVVCTSRTNCWALGTPFARWNGKAWKIATYPRSNRAALVSIACPKSSECFAVGSDWSGHFSAYKTRPLIERWNGSKWTVETIFERVWTDWTHTTSKVIATSNGTPLTKVVCKSAHSCTASGPISELNRSLWVVRWTGSKWSLSK